MKKHRTVPASFQRPNAGTVFFTLPVRCTNADAFIYPCATAALARLAQNPSPEIGQFRKQALIDSYQARDPVKIIRRGKGQVFMKAVYSAFIQHCRNKLGTEEPVFPLQRYIKHYAQQSDKVIFIQVLVPLEIINADFQLFKLAILYFQHVNQARRIAKNLKYTFIRPLYHKPAD